MSQPLFVYISVASDIMELFVLFNETHVMQNEILTCVVLGTWLVSLLSSPWLSQLQDTWLPKC